MSTSLVTGDSATRSTRRRVPAGNLEAIVIDRLRTFFTSRSELLDAIDKEGSGKTGQGQLINRGRQAVEELGQTPEKTKAIVMALIRRVEVRPDCIKIGISQDGLGELLAAHSPDLLGQQPKQTDSSERITLTAPAQLKRVGREMKLLVDDDANRAPDMGLLRIVARAHDVQTRLAQDTSLTVHDAARDERVTAAYIYVLLRLR